LSEYVLLTATGLTILLGAVHFWVLLAERRRKSLRQRLAMMSSASRTVGKPETPLLLLRSPTRRQLRRFYSPARELLTRLDAALAAAGNRIGLPHLMASGIVAAATTIGFAVTITQLPTALAVALGGAAALAFPALVMRLAQDRYQKRFLDVFPDALDLIVRAVRAGLPALEAMELATREIPAPVGTELRRILDETRIGVGIEDGLQRAAERIRVPDFRFFVVSLVLQRRTGGGLAETLSNLSTVIRQRKALRRKARALTAEPKASAAIVAIMPLIASVGLFFLNPQMMVALFVDPRGRFMLGVAVVNLVLGIALMNFMIRKSQR